MGNGAKKAETQKRKAAEKKKEPKSQLKSNEKSKTEQCVWCLTPFMLTANDAQLVKHVRSDDRHPDAKKCFPNRKWKIDPDLIP